jgi:hypothetical protein
MLQVLLWALATGGITGAAWVGIVLMGRQKRLAREHRELLVDRQRTLDALEAVQQQVMELEDRLDFAERRLRQPEDAQPPRLPS